MNDEKENEGGIGMNIALMSGAYVNAGDFLIEHRCKMLIENILRANVDVLKRDIAYDDSIDKLNQYDAIVFGGGPGFQRNLYPNKVPFVDRLDDIKVPIRILGWGWKGINDEYRNIQNYDFGKKMLSFIKFIEKQYPLSSRDWQTIRLLKENDINSNVMTGCPAWYDISMITQLDLDNKYKNKSMSEDIKIGISDAAYPQNRKYFWHLIDVIRNRFPMAELLVFFHRGLNCDDLNHIIKLCDSDKKMKYLDMTGSYQSFSHYDECYFHIGFRVHAHIYNLSRGNVSVLINEDARGIGVNHALGLENINCCLTKRGFGNNRTKMDELGSVLNNYLDYIIRSKYMQYDRAIYSISQTYDVMYKYIADMI